MPVTSSMVQRPSKTQAPMMPTAGSAQTKSPSQPLTQLERPTAFSAWLTRPVDANIQLQAMPAATSGMTCGRNRIVRVAMPKRPFIWLRMAEATASPNPTGIRVK
jgi:hypothetical protein